MTPTPGHAYHTIPDLFSTLYALFLGTFKDPETACCAVAWFMDLETEFEA